MANRADGKGIRARAADWIMQRASSISCGACGRQAFTLGNEVHLPMVREDSDEMGAFTVIPWVCDYCGHVHFFNAAMMGFRQPG